jgi:predicted Zn-dependent protease
MSQTVVKAPSNKYSVQYDIQVGDQVAELINKNSRFVEDEETVDLVNKLGNRLIEKASLKWQGRFDFLSQFKFSFKIIDTPQVNAFALPGGHIYVTKGLIIAAKNEADLAGAMAHEVSHVLLRHGTANLTKAESNKIKLLSFLAMILDFMGGNGLANTALNVYFLKFSREFENQADIVGAQLLADAGYNPQCMQSMLQTLENLSNGGGLAFLMDHPLNRERVKDVEKEISLLAIDRSDSPSHDLRKFWDIQNRLKNQRR